MRRLYDVYAKLLTNSLQVVTLPIEAKSAKEAWCKASLNAAQPSLKTTTL
jgi:hypothetical protein